MAVKTFDFTGQVCPLPVINTIKQFKQLSAGDCLEIVTDDPLAMKSIPEEIACFGVKITVNKISAGWKILIEK
ncbi:MAG: sulfurtransferase TusA family protein [Candidatus Omnitrophica bacterium]|nr:sulfurtransferase TusA family protein [Candidatus Omnitrophota bacterium]